MPSFSNKRYAEAELLNHSYDAEVALLTNNHLDYMDMDEL